MKRLLILAGIVSAMAVSLIASADTQSQVRDGVFIHISQGMSDPHRVLMALRMAELMSEEHDVLVYFDISGVEVVLKDSPDIQFKEFTSSKTQIEKLIAKSVPLMACPGCLKAAGKTPADLAPGVTLADKAAFFSFTKGRILSLDY